MPGPQRGYRDLARARERRADQLDQLLAVAGAELEAWFVGDRPDLDHVRAAAAAIDAALAIAAQPEVVDVVVGRLAEPRVTIAAVPS